MGSGNGTHDKKNGKKKNQIISIDGGVGGLVVLGGAMAVTIFMVIATAFSGKKTSRKNVNLEKVEEKLDCGCPSEDNVNIIQRLSSLDDQHSKPTDQDSCCRRCGRPKISTNHEASQFMSRRSMVLDKLAPKSNDESPTYDHQEMFLLSDDSRPETVASGDEIGTLTEESPDTSTTSDNPYFEGEKLARRKSLISEESAKVKDSFENRKKTHEKETENDGDSDVTMELNNAAENERSSETKSTLHKRQGKTLKIDELVKEDINDGAGRHCHDNTTGLKILTKEVIKKSMAKSAEGSNHPVGLRVRILFMMLLSIPFLILFLTYTAAFYLDSHSYIAIA